MLEKFASKSNYANHGQRVIVGQHLMQAASDIFLGWTQGEGGRQFYTRQLCDMKIKPLVELFNPATMFDYATLCGWTLARAHTRSGDSAMMAGYMGKSDVICLHKGSPNCDTTLSDDSSPGSGGRSGKL